VFDELTLGVTCFNGHETSSFHPGRAFETGKTVDPN
jgi:hypothetical protein